MEKSFKIPENLVNEQSAGFHIMRQFIIDVFGGSYLERLTQVAKAEFAKSAILNFTPSDANTVIDVSPMPDPWRGQWGYRIRFVSFYHVRDEPIVLQFYVPQSTIPAFKKGDFTSMS